MASSTLTATIYRALLRTCKELHKSALAAGETNFTFRLPVDEEAWSQGKFKWHPPGTGKRPMPHAYLVAQRCGFHTETFTDYSMGGCTYLCNLNVQTITDKFWSVCSRILRR